ncbi:MAG: type I-E CRISPR-associated protein Cas6/Cse3/CasE [Plesiomonas sp.]
MSLYASVLRLDRAAIKALKITDLYSLHRVVYDLFDDVRSPEQKEASVSSGIQWVDKGGDHQYRQILMLSDRLPRDCPVGQVESKPLPDHFLTHQHYRFNVTLTPSKRENVSRKLVPITGKEAIATWFIERANVNWGFSVDPLRLQIDDIRVVRTKDKQQRDITLQQASLSGYFTVTDTTLFTKSVTSGIGRGRAFGCGLLQIVPVIESPLF